MGRPNSTTRRRASSARRCATGPTSAAATQLCHIHPAFGTPLLYKLLHLSLLPIQWDLSSHLLLGFREHSLNKLSAAQNAFISSNGCPTGPP